MTATDFPCKAQWLKLQPGSATYAPTMQNKIAYNLCLATHKAGIYITDAGHWIWRELRSLWARLWGATKAVARATAEAVKAAADFSFRELQYLLGQSQALLNWIIQKFERGALEFLAIAGVIAGMIWFAPEILDGIGEAYAGKYKRHYSSKLQKQFMERHHA